MNMLEKLDYLKSKTGDNNHSLAIKADIPYTTIDGLYKKGYSNTKLTTLIKLSEYFCITLDELCKDTLPLSELAEIEKKAPEVASDLGVNEVEKINLSLKDLLPEERAKVLAYSEALRLTRTPSADPQQGGSCKS